MSDTTDKKDQVRVHVIFDADEVHAIDDYSFKARIRTRSEAIRSLIKRGLEAELGLTTDDEMTRAVIAAARQYPGQEKQFLDLIQKSSRTLGDAIRTGDVNTTSLREMEQHDAFLRGLPKVDEKSKV
jgi:hypothetical protein